MRHLSKVLGLILAVTVMAAPSFAAMEAGAQAPAELTLSDFRQAYGWTKPTVAVRKFHRYKAFGEAPMPTLHPSRIRTRDFILAEDLGTKPGTRHMKKHYATREGLEFLEPWAGQTKPAMRHHSGH